MSLDYYKAPKKDFLNPNKWEYFGNYSDTRKWKILTVDEINKVFDVGYVCNSLDRGVEVWKYEGRYYTHENSVFWQKLQKKWWSRLELKYSKFLKRYKKECPRKITSVSQGIANVNLLLSFAGWIKKSGIEIECDERDLNHLNMVARR
ncbi:MAG: hypothetical protein ACE5IR_09585 [bacterium]